VFAQIHSNEPLLECRVLASAIAPTEEEAVAAAMAKAGVTELVTGPRPRSDRPAAPEREKSFLAGLAACEIALDELIGAIHGH
jgi:hypothetical protein